MTDLDNMRALFDGLGIEVSTEPPTSGDEERIATGDRLLVIKRGTGYHGFYTAFWFDAAGKYLDYGVWE